MRIQNIGRAVALRAWSSASKCNNKRVTQSATGLQDINLTNDVKRTIEEYWRPFLNADTFNYKNSANKFYVLSMFPYPSGNLHMGHVRVYTIGDTVARFHRMCGKNVFQPIGWDAFGLPAENAANQRGIEPQIWTEQNISQMREQLQELGCSFNWECEIKTCHPTYYRWTQMLFLLLYQEGLVYQNEALVNWDPVDCTVLADEQVDENGYSWRSGALVEKKVLKQWFIRTTNFAEQLLDGLDDPTLIDWKDIINLQRHWIGECNGYSFQLETTCSTTIRIWTTNPEYFIDKNAFIVLKKDHYLLSTKATDSQQIYVINPFTNTNIPIIFSNEANFPEGCDVYLASPNFCDKDKSLLEKLQLKMLDNLNHIDYISADIETLRSNVINMAKEQKLGGYKVSSKLKDWLISRQRYWGTPIPIVYCSNCGVVPVPISDIPIILLNKLDYSSASKRYSNNLECICPKCGIPNAQREMDTMDTFVDSSWYYLRYLDVNNNNNIFNSKIINDFMPVDIYVGGKEHAVLHLYYARFVNHFLHSIGLVTEREPFQRLIVQGMVMGRTYRLKSSGQYLTEKDVNVINAKKNKAVLKDTNEPVNISWEKMSKSKMNGVDPKEMFQEYGCDTTRLIILADVAPTSHRNWSTATFPGIINWQKRLWLTLNEFYYLRSLAANGNFPGNVDINSDSFLQEDYKLYDARNFYIKGVTFNFRHSHQLSVGISKMQGLTNSIRRATKPVICYGKHYEKCLAAQLIMLAPAAPHFASELWSKFISTPQRINLTDSDWDWDKDVLLQKWPLIDNEYKVNLLIKINGYDNCTLKIEHSQIDCISQDKALDLALQVPSVISFLADRKIRTTKFINYPGIESILNIYADKIKSEPNEMEELLIVKDEKNI